VEEGGRVIHGNGHTASQRLPLLQAPSQAGWGLAKVVWGVVFLMTVATWAEMQFCVISNIQATTESAQSVARTAREINERERLLDEANKTVEIRQAAILVQQERLRDATEENLRLAAELKKRMKGE
jgi:hypothetical protein